MNSTNKVTKKTFFGGCHEMGMAADDEDCEELWGLVDSDNSGEVSHEDRLLSLLSLHMIVISIIIIIIIIISFLFLLLLLVVVVVVVVVAVVVVVSKNGGIYQDGVWPRARRRKAPERGSGEAPQARPSEWFAMFRGLVPGRLHVFGGWWEEYTK